MMADRAKMLEKPSVRQSPFFQKFTDELKAWTECYNKSWEKACRETAECFKKVEAFLVLPSNRTEMRQILIQSFLAVHPESINLSDVLGKPPGAVLGSERDMKAIMDRLTVNENLIRELLKVTSLLLVDDWFGTGSNMFAVQARIAALAGKEIALGCAVPGIAQDADWLNKHKARKAALMADMLRDAELPANHGQVAP